MIGLSLSVLGNQDSISGCLSWILSSSLNLVTFKSTSQFPAFPLDSRVTYLTDFLTSPYNVLLGVSNLPMATTKLINSPHHSFPATPTAMPLFKPKSSFIFVSILTSSTTSQSSKSCQPSLQNTSPKSITSQHLLQCPATTSPQPLWSKPAAPLTWMTSPASILMSGLRPCSPSTTPHV